MGSVRPYSVFVRGRVLVMRGIGRTRDGWKRVGVWESVTLKRYMCADEYRLCEESAVLETMVEWCMVSGVRTPKKPGMGGYWCARKGGP